MTEQGPVLLCEHGGRRILGVRRRTGVCEAEVFIASLPVGAKIDFQTVMSRLTEFGRVTNPERFRRADSKGQPPVWEMKSHEGPGYRLFCIQEGPDWWATHGQKKPKPKQLSREVARAREIFAERSSA